MLKKLKSKFVNWLLKDVHLKEIHIGEHSVVVSGTGINMDSQDITDGGSITATELHGAVYYGDMFFEDVKCAKCHREFMVGERVRLEIVGLIPTGFRAIPVHLEC